MPDPAVPRSLRSWFVLHFGVDVAFALPLLVAPEATLRLFGWTTVDPVATRLVAAALLGIGGQSFLGRDGSLAAYRSMLDLKILWSSAAILGLALSLAQGAPRMAWLFLALFAAFAAVWTRYRLALR